jgi:hypothetical protein
MEKYAMVACNLAQEAIYATVQKLFQLRIVASLMVESASRSSSPAYIPITYCRNYDEVLIGRQRSCLLGDSFDQCATASGVCEVDAPKRCAYEAGI